MARGNMLRQKGAALLISLIVMALMVLGVLSFSRSADTANLIAGNTAFRQASTQAAEIGIEAAAEFVDSLATPDATVANAYYATRLARDANDLPVGIDWNAVAGQQVGAYRIQQVVERMCDATPVVDPVTQCSGRTAPSQGSQKAGSPVLQGQPAIYYLATVRVAGPRNAESLVQAAFSR
jgi:Tfp pilus assembly protein PilX